MLRLLPVLCVLPPPDFESEWHTLVAQTEGSLTITHSLGQMPLLVDVRVKAKDGPNKDFIFPGNGI